MPRRLLALLCALVVVAPAGPAEAAPGGTVWHVVKPGQTMADIARAYRVRLADLRRWNQVAAPDRAQVDATLRLNRPPAALPAWRTRVAPVSPASVGWDPRRRCPVPPADLRRIWVSYVDFQGRYHDGSIVMHKSLVTATQRAFYWLYRWRYRIMGMAPMWVNMPGQTDMSIVTSGFRCRPVAGTRTWSQHAYGRAIDLNPLQNPMVRGTYIDPPAGTGWLRRDRYRIGMVHAEGAVRAFTANGFHWGGRWRTLKDYMHFSTTNR
ncbi:M15 family metallopeptidase [Jidongwangia harbinensis]|uniref:M15 family metallopeptidase n=1 Tax=Jidongwangia harbinensis TaxID=2878561 RepID=UPI001CDA2A32|nr:M15 family metallopeptidase [Jidongwangia harbinensis]MCA2217344.1 M15 family metallopeptidase [Jidongwangia harbinensis]